MTQQLGPGFVDQLVSSLEERENPRRGIVAPPEMRFQLAAGYFDMETLTWHQDFIVRELTGRDEEAVAKIRTAGAGQTVTELITRGLVSVGGIPATREVVDSLLAGDWETVLLAIRSVTFGDTADFSWSCYRCEEPYEFTIAMAEIPRRTHTSYDDARFTLETGGKTYEVQLPTGEIQRKLVTMADKTTNAEMNSLVLAECVTAINGRPMLGRDEVLDMPVRARRAILDQIDNRRPGPRMGEVKTTCPACAAENDTPLTIAAFFQW